MYGYYPSRPQTDGIVLRVRGRLLVVRWKKPPIDALSTMRGRERLRKSSSIQLAGDYALEGGTEVGASLQYGMRARANIRERTVATTFRLSGHNKNAWVVHPLLTVDINIYNITDDNPGKPDLIPMGAYD